MSYDDLMFSETLDEAADRYLDDDTLMAMDALAAKKRAQIAAIRPVRKAHIPAPAIRLTGEPFADLRAIFGTAGGKKMLAEITDQLEKQHDQGWSQGSVRLAAEIARRVTPTNAEAPDPNGAFKLNNDLIPAIARLTLHDRPEWRGWLEVRRMAGESAELAEAYNTPGHGVVEDPRLDWA